MISDVGWLPKGQDVMPKVRCGHLLTYVTYNGHIHERLLTLNSF